MIEKLTPWLGWTGFLFGLITAICSPMSGYAKLTFLCMIPGFFLSSLHIMLSSKYRLTYKYIHPGYIGVLLSSAPLILALYFYLTK